MKRFCLVGQIMGDESVAFWPKLTSSLGAVLKIHYAGSLKTGAELAMKRREFIALVGGAATTWSLVARAQDTSKAPKQIVFLPNLNLISLEDWRADMRVLGWTEGRDFVVAQSGIEAGSREPFDEAAYRVVASKPDLICTGSSAYALAAQRGQFLS